MQKPFTGIQKLACIHYSQFRVQGIKTLIRTIKREETVERGAHFHPTIGSVTPN
jgi:hypothetical protein